MNYGPVIFLAAFLAMSASWYGLVVKPSMEVGRLLHTNVLGGSITYPVARPGLATKGREVYRANGCAQCHSQQITQTGAVLEVVLTDPGTNAPATIAELLKLDPKLDESRATQFLTEPPPRTFITMPERGRADAAIKAINATSAKASLQVTPVGADLARGWGRRRSVAEDFLYESTVMLGSQRVGPDLASVGSRLPGIAWHLRHLYAPRADVKGSIMPPYRYLFEVRKIRNARSQNALDLPAEFAPPSGYEVVPTEDAVALASYLVSLRADAALFSAPMNIAAAAPPANADTNAVPAGTNAPATEPLTNSAAK